MKRPGRRQRDVPQSPAAPGGPGRSVVAGGDISGIASTGDDAVNVQYRADQMTVLPAEALRPWAELAAPAGLSNLPQPGLFVGRASELARLDAAMAGPGGVVVQAVHGLGGVGKSTLAARWAAAHAADYGVAWWITAATPADIDAGLAALAVALAPALTGVLPLEGLREGAVQWLAAHSGWLVILDNVTDPADVVPLLARASAGRYLITSRRASGWHGTAVPVRLDVLEAAEAQALLAAILPPDRPQDADDADRLCEELGFLPLAIEQVGAYMAQAGATPAEYLGLLARYPAAMYQAGSEGGDAARTIARIWRVTVDRLAGDPLAGQVLRILAWYAPDGIPRTLLDGLADPPAVLHAVGRLAAYSMLTAGPGTVAVHRLVQAVTRTPDPGDLHRDPQAIDAARDQATRQLADAIPDWRDPAGWPGWRMLLPHIDALASHAPPDTDTEDTAYLLNEAGLFLDSQGQPGRAAGYLQRALAGDVRVLGADHPDTLVTRNNLAGAYASAGYLGRAMLLYEQTLADSVRVLGADHTQTLTSRNNLAYIYQAAGDLGRAIPLYEQALADSVRVLGADHTQTLTSRNNLAY
ncbi:MAG: tetratricopeptide repeat protein, partial [Streptosporangiaceae bacterium]